MPQTILDATAEQLPQAQAKITFIGTQSKPIPTVIVATAAGAPWLDEFTVIQNQRTYENDTERVSQFLVSPQEMHKLLGSVRGSVVAQASGSQPRVLSFCVARKKDDQVVGEQFWVESAKASGFYRQLLDALPRENEKGRAALESQRQAVCGG